MPDFGFTEEQETFRREMRNFVQKELVPGARERSKLDVLPDDKVAKLVEMKIPGLTIPAEYGGQPCDWITMGISTEELA